MSDAFLDDIQRIPGSERSVTGNPISSDNPEPMPRAVFMGTPAVAVSVLAALRGVAQVALVITRPDRPRGRSRRLKSPPVKETAREWSLPVAQPESAAELLDVVRAVEPDVAVVAAYGRLIAVELLEVPGHGFVNVHCSLLPRWRGASPVVRSILAGDDETGVSLIRMDAGFDTGPIIASEVVPIDSGHTTGSLSEELATVGGRLLVTALPPYLAGQTEAVPQDDAMTTAAAKVTTDEAHIYPALHSTEAVDRAVRAFNPKPGAWCLFHGERLKIWKSTSAQDVESTPGEVRMIDGKVILGNRTGSTELVTVQPSGKPMMSGIAWMNGRRGEPAELR